MFIETFDSESGIINASDIIYAHKRDLNPDSTDGSDIIPLIVLTLRGVGERMIQYTNQARRDEAMDDIAKQLL